MQKPLIVLVGPTASGKTELALELIKKFPLEIISADSRQIYRFMDIGTGKPLRKKEHRLIDVADPDEAFTAADFVRLAENAAGAIYREGKIPFVVGGSGLYIKVFIDGLCEAPPADEVIRKKLLARAESDGIRALHEELAKVDPEAAEKISPNDSRRTVRALEVFELTRKPISYFQKKTKKPQYRVLMLGIRFPAAELYERINRRCGEMLKSGLVEEVRGLAARGYDGKLKAMDGLGYKEALGFINGKYTFDEMTRLFKMNTRRYAKRQMTWFRKDRRINWIDASGRGTDTVVTELSYLIEDFLKGSTGK